MKHLKTQEELNQNEQLPTFFTSPQIGDWCIVKDPFGLDNVDEFINNNVGYIWSKTLSEKDFYVKYFNIPPQVKKYFNWPENYNNTEDYNSILASHKEITHWSKNKEDLEAILNSNKFNL